MDFIPQLIGHRAVTGGRVSQTHRCGMWEVPITRIPHLCNDDSDKNKEVDGS